ncbi:MAG: hypothetical protein KAQ85_04230 [Thermodesulfovibrionia bacterium]|nr:hypothetical protein [Thermodesulfovibrionia bacterium]
MYKSKLGYECKTCNGPSKCIQCEGTGRCRMCVILPKRGIIEQVENCPCCDNTGICHLCHGTGASSICRDCVIGSIADMEEKQGNIEKFGEVTDEMTGAVKCNSCGGTAICPTCGGDGLCKDYRPPWKEWEAVYDEYTHIGCAFCKGTMRCRTCGGTGVCPSCRGGWVMPVYR